MRQSGGQTWTDTHAQYGVRWWEGGAVVRHTQCGSCHCKLRYACSVFPKGMPDFADVEVLYCEMVFNLG